MYIVTFPFYNALEATEIFGALRISTFPKTAVTYTWEGTTLNENNSMAV